MKPILTTCCLMLINAIAFAQTGSLTGKLVDSASRQPVSLATISVFHSRDTTLASYRMSNPDGNFRITGLPRETPLSVIITYSGLRVYRTSIQLSAGEQKDLGTIPMIPDTKSLDEVLVYAERPPVTIKNDTIEFNAAAFKTLPTALVEDLLKKLPGVMIDRDGNIVVNGRKVNRLLVDGKDFFGSDHRTATRNLPANIIDKIQVSEDKDEAELNPDKPATELGQVINLKLKKSIKKGWFGKAYAGAGSSDLHEAGTIVNLFKDTLQVSLLGYTNNLDRAGFNIGDIQSLGGFNRGGLDDYVINSRGLNVNNFSFGGQGEGINSSSAAGFNLNNVLKNGLTLNSQYFYGYSRNDIKELNHRRQFIGDTALVTDLQRNGTNKTFNHRVALGLKGKINTSTRFEFKPMLLFRKQNSTNTRLFDNADSYNGLLNENENNQLLRGSGMSYDHSLVFFKSFAKKGRSFNFSNTINYGKNNNDQFTVSDTRFYLPVIMDSTIDQLRSREAGDFAVSLFANWNEPLSKKFSFRLNYRLNIQRTSDGVTTFTKNTGSGKYEDVNSVLTNEVRRTVRINQLSPAFNFTNKLFSASANIFVMRLDLDNRLGKQLPGIERHYNYLLPAANMRWKSLSMSYSMGVNPPSLADLQTVPDNSNPLYINNGNPDLEPTITNTIRMNYNKPVPAKSQYFRAGMSISFRDNAVIHKRSVYSDGRQETTPVNINGLLNVSPSLGLEKQYKLNNNVQFTYNLNGDFSFSRNYIIINDQKSYVKAINIFPELNTSLNWKDKYELNLGYTRRFGHTWYETAGFKEVSVFTSKFSGEFILRSLKRVVLETQLDQRYNSQVSAGIQKTSTLWNAAITWLFLKDDKGLLKLSAYDLLKENINVSRIVTENYTQDRQINSLTRYLLLTFTYSIRDFKQGRIGGRQKFFLF